jgi:RHS repeat-associated protein
MTDSTGTTFYEYDELKRPTAITTSKNSTQGDSDDLRLAYEYDLAGRRTAVVYPGGERVEYLYDSAGRMTTVNNVTRSLVFNYTYNPATGQLIKLTRPNGIETLNSYDGMGRLTTIRHQKTAGAVLVQEFFYTLDAAGKATEVRVTLPGNVIRREGYSYDRFDRLTQVIYADDGTLDANDRTQIWTYDGNGNRLTQTTKVNNVVTEVRNYAYGNENRLLKATNQIGATVAEYRYDSAGNRIQKITPAKTTNYSYDERNLMVSYNDGTTFVTFEYDGNGQRVASTLNGIRKDFVNDTSLAYYDAVQERNGSGAVTGTTTFGQTRLASNGVQTSMQLDDRTGTSHILTDGTGAIVTALRYDAFGAESSDNGFARFGSAAAEPTTGLYFMRARFYDPETGSFVSKDPLGIAAGLNSFVYIGGNPINNADPELLPKNPTGA